MVNKAQAFAQLAEDTAKGLTRNLENWTGFLSTMGRLYKYPYHEQLMIYAQRPDARACAEYDLWNNTMNRYVRRGSKGIALIDTTADIPRLRYVFDISDTGGRENSHRPYLWEMQEHHKQPILEMLADKYNTKENNLSNAFYKIAEDLAKEYYDNHKRDIPYLIENSFLEGYDEDNIKVAFENAATVSIAYALIKRCGLNPDKFFEHENFLSIFDFNTQDAVALLGTAVSEQSEQVFREIARTIIKIERERRNEHERNNLREEGGLSNTRSDLDTGRTTSREIRKNEKEISSATPNTLIQFPTAERETVSPSDRDRPGSQQEAHTDNDELTESTASTRQDDRPDGMGGLHEHPEITGRGNHTEGSNIQLSLFPTEQEQIQRITENERTDKPFRNSVFSMPQEAIDNILRTGSNRDNSLLRIVSFYQKDKSIEEKVNFLQEKYQGGKGLYIDGEKLSIWFYDDGIHIAKGDTALYSNSKQVISWIKVAERIEELLRDGQYVTQDILDKVGTYERQEVAQTLWYLHQNFSDKARNQFFDEEIFQGGFPDSTKHIAQLLDNPKEREIVIESLEEFNSAYKEDPELLRFHFHKPQKTLSDIKDLQIPKREFNANITETSDYRMFITQDEVDKELTSGSGIQGGKLRIYEFFTEPHSPKEKEDFLKKEYGTGGRSHALSGADNSNQQHDAKGILYSRRENDDNLLLNWNKVAKRIDYLISNDRYMTAQEKEEFEKQEEEKIGIVEIPPAPPIVDEPVSSPLLHHVEDKTIEIEEEIEENIIPFQRGDTVYLENGSPF